MELNEINSSKMTDKVVESMIGTEDEPLYTNDSMKAEVEHINVDREENEELYEADYEEYSSGFEIMEKSYTSHFGFFSQGNNNGWQDLWHGTCGKKCIIFNLTLKFNTEVSASNGPDNFEPRYRFRYQEYGRTRKTLNPRNAHSVDGTVFEKIIKRKWWLFGMILASIFGGVVVGLSIFFTETKASTMSDHPFDIIPKDPYYDSTTSVQAVFATSVQAVFD